MTLQEVYKEAMRLSLPEQRMLNSMLVDRIKAVNNLAAARCAIEFSVGDKVRPNESSRRLPKHAEGTVTKVGQKNISVDFGAYGPWRVNASFLTKLPDTVKA